MYSAEIFISGKKPKHTIFEADLVFGLRILYFCKEQTEYCQERTAVCSFAIINSPKLL